jgi:hypothetical protein
MNESVMEIPRLDLPLRNCGAAVVTSATNWRLRAYASLCESQSKWDVRLWEAAIPKLNRERLESWQNDGEKMSDKLKFVAVSVKRPIVERLRQTEVCRTPQPQFSE